MEVEEIFEMVIFPKSAEQFTYIMHLEAEIESYQFIVLIYFSQYQHFQQVRYKTLIWLDIIRREAIWTL